MEEEKEMRVKASYGYDKLLELSKIQLINYGKNLENTVNNTFDTLILRDRYKLYKRYIMDEFDILYGLNIPSDIWHTKLTKNQIVLNIAVFEDAKKRLKKHLKRGYTYGQ